MDTPGGATTAYNVVTNTTDEIITVTASRTGAATGNVDIETYDYYAQTGLLLNQTVVKVNNSS